jgi:transcription elongation GreA/GreB family factor
VLRQLRYWRTRLSTAQLAPAPAPGEAGIGSHVAFTLHGKARVITIVGHDETNPVAGLLSFHAPLAQALLGGAVGDMLDFGGKEAAIEVLAVEPAASLPSPET